MAINWKRRYEKLERDSKKKLDQVQDESARIHCEAAGIKSECSKLLAGSNALIAQQQGIIRYLEEKVKENASR